MDYGHWLGSYGQVPNIFKIMIRFTCNKRIVVFYIYVMQYHDTKDFTHTGLLFFSIKLYQMSVYVPEACAIFVCLVIVLLNCWVGLPAAHFCKDWEMLCSFRAKSGNTGSSQSCLISCPDPCPEALMHTLCNWTVHLVVWDICTGKVYCSCKAFPLYDFVSLPFVFLLCSPYLVCLF